MNAYSAPTNASLKYSNSTTNASIHFCDVIDIDDHDQGLKQPNIALLSLSLCIATCAIALAFKQLRSSNFFSSIVRRK